MTISGDSMSEYLSRRDAIRLMGAAAAAGLMGGFWPAYGDTSSKPNKPNIIFILADNIQYDDFGFMNHPFIRTRDWTGWPVKVLSSKMPLIQLRFAVPHEQAYLPEHMLTTTG